MNKSGDPQVISHRLIRRINCGCVPVVLEALESDEWRMRNVGDILLTSRRQRVFGAGVKRSAEEFQDSMSGVNIFIACPGTYEPMMSELKPFERASARSTVRLYCTVLPLSRLY